MTTRSGFSELIDGLFDSISYSIKNISIHSKPIRCHNQAYQILFLLPKYSKKGYFTEDEHNGDH
jgi:hypothetical protein